jgi:hypothetical protein
MRVFNLKYILFLFLCLFGYVPFLLAQHYIFIEAEGQQPFYLKKSGETYSSTAKGFIILSKLDAKEIEFVIGFPNNLFPEVAFKVNALVKDRGFYLKQADGKGWVLLDRSNSELISGGMVQAKTITSSSSSSTGFAELLADATGDKTLVDRSSLVSTPAAKPVAANVKGKPTSSVAKGQTNPKQINKPTDLGVIRSFIQSDDSLALRITYLEKGAKENWDTIYVEIEKMLDKTVSQPLMKMDSNRNPEMSLQNQDKELVNPVMASNLNTNLAADCVNPIALPKDIRELQRRISRSSSFEEQIASAIKSFSEKCYTTKQIKELGGSFMDEQNRLTFFERARKWVVDPALYSELEKSFLQESSVKAFREMMKKQSQ